MHPHASNQSPTCININNATYLNAKYIHPFIHHSAKHSSVQPPFLQHREQSVIVLLSSHYLNNPQPPIPLPTQATVMLTCLVATNPQARTHILSKVGIINGNGSNTTNGSNNIDNNNTNESSTDAPTCPKVILVAVKTNQELDMKDTLCWIVKMTWA